jgi:hypothetical protein
MHNLPIREFQRIMLGGWDFFIDLAEDRSPMFERASAPRPHTLAPDFVREGKLCTGRQQLHVELEVPRTLSPDLARLVVAAEQPLQQLRGTILRAFIPREKIGSRTVGPTHSTIRAYVSMFVS